MGCVSALQIVNGKEMIVGDISIEVAKIIAKAARESDKIKVVIYRESKTNLRYERYYRVWRYLSSEKNLIYVQRYSNATPFPIRSETGLRNFMTIPGSSTRLCNQKWLYVVLSGEVTVPKTMDIFTFGKVTPECLTVGKYFEYVCEWNYFKDKDTYKQLPAFIWGILS